MPIGFPFDSSTPSATLYARMRFTTGAGFSYDLTANVLATTMTITRGRQSAYESSISAATCSVTFDDPTGILDNDNTGSPLTGLLTPGPMATATFRVDHYVTSLNQYFPLFTGRLDSLERTFTNGTYSETACTFVDQTSELTRHIPAAGTSLPAELAGARIARLLTTPSRSGFTWATRSQAAPTALDPGQKILGAATTDGNTSSWDLAIAAASAEDGLLYFDAAGVLVFHGQARRLVRNVAWNLTDAIYKDATPTGIEYQNDLTYRISTDNLIVDAGVTTVDGTTSIYGPGGFSQVAPGVTVGLTAGAQLDITETSALAGWNSGSSRAHHLVQDRGTPRRNAPVVTVDPVSYLGQWTVNGAATPYQMGILAGIDDLTLLTRHPSSGSLISFNHWIEGSTVNMANDGTWKVTYYTSRADNVPTNGYWRLSASQFSLNTILTW